MSFIENYKKGLAVIAGTLCLVVALFLPAKAALGLTDSMEVWTSLNWIFLGLAIIFLWGSIMSLAKSVQSFVSKKVD